MKQKSPIKLPYGSASILMKEFGCCAELVSRALNYKTNSRRAMDIRIMARKISRKYKDK